MLLGDLQRFIHTLPDGDGGNHDDELSKVVLLVQFKDRLGVNVGFSRPRLHLDGKLVACQIIRLWQIVPFLNRLHIGQQRFFANTKGVPDTVFRLQDSLISALLHAKSGGGSPLTLEKRADSINGSGLEILLFEFEFHILSPRVLLPHSFQFLHNYFEWCCFCFLML